MVVRRAVLFGVLILGGCVLGVQGKPAVAKGPTPRTIAVRPASKRICNIALRVTVLTLGARDRLRSCSRHPPPDLTMLAKRHDGKFPYEYVSDVLRFGTRILSHGSSDMPIWGPIFGSLDNYNEPAVRKRIKDLSDYLASLQQKES